MQIYKKCLHGLLKRKTRIVCTHHSRFLTNANEIHILEDGKIIETGTPAQLLPKISNQFRDNLETNKFGRRRNNSSLDELDSSGADSRSNYNVQPSDSNEEEVSESGVVSLKVYLTYWNSVGHLLGSMILMSLILMQGTRNYTDVWLANWVSQNGTEVSYYLKVYGSIGTYSFLFQKRNAELNKYI